MSVGVSLPLAFRIGAYPPRAGLFPPFSIYFGAPGDAVVPPEQPPHGTVYRAPFLRLHQEHHYEYKPDGGLVFSGSAICQRMALIHRSYLPQIGGSGIAGSAAVSGSHSLNSAYSGSGGLSWGGEVTVSYYGQRVQSEVGSGGLGVSGSAELSGAKIRH